MAVYYSEEYANRIKERYARIEALMKEVFEQNNRCTAAWNLLRWSLRKTERNIPYNDGFFEIYFSGHHECTTIEGMDLICLFFERKDFAKEEFLSLRHAGIRTIRKFEEVWRRLNGVGA